MSLFKETAKGDLKAKNRKSRVTTESERRIILIGITVLLLVAAVILLSIGNSGRSALQGCKSIILSKQRYYCMYSLANETNNYTLCNEIPNSNLAHGCIIAIAENTHNVSACGMVNSSAAQYNDCVESISYSESNPDYCDLLNGENVSTCMFSIAKKNQFESMRYCDSIPNGAERTLCGYIYYYNAATLPGKASYCSLLPDSPNSTTLSEIATSDYTNHSSVSNLNFLALTAINTTARSFCYYEVAIATANKTLCGYSGSALGAECYDYLNSTNLTSEFNNVSSVCAGAPSYARDICNYTVFTEKALSQKNVSSCFMISNSSYTDSCIVQLAYNYNDSTYCNYITDSNTSKEACYSSASRSIIK